MAWGLETACTKKKVGVHHHVSQAASLRIDNLRLPIQHDLNLLRIRSLSSQRCRKALANDLGLQALNIKKKTGTGVPCPAACFCAHRGKRGCWPAPVHPGDVE